MSFSGQFSALNRRQFLIFWLGSFASVGATQLQIMVQGWLVWELTGSALMLGYLGAAAGIPAIIMTLFGGVLADRLNKKRLLITTSFCTSLLLLLLASLDLSGLVSAWHVIAVAGAISIVSGLDWPTRQAIFPGFIEREDMMSAVALNSIVWQSCRMVFPAMGGLAIAFFNTGVVLVFCAAGFAVMGFVMTTLSVPPPATTARRESTLHQVAEGFRFIFGHRLFLVLIGLTYATNLLATSYMQLMPAFSDLLDAGSSGYGYLLAATGVGSVTGTFLIGALQYSRRLGWILFATSGISALFVYLFSLATAFSDVFSFAYGAGMAAVFLASLFTSMFLIASMTVIQLEVPDALRGRVMGLHGITYSLMPLGGLLAGGLAALSSPPVAIAITVTFYLVILIGCALSQHQVRNISGTSLHAI